MTKSPAEEAERLALADLPSPETMLTYASILEKPQYQVDPKTGIKYRLATGEIVEAACAALRYCAALPQPAAPAECAVTVCTCRPGPCQFPAAPGGEPVAFIPSAEIEQLRSRKLTNTILYRDIGSVDEPSKWSALYASAPPSDERAKVVEALSAAWFEMCLAKVPGDDSGMVLACAMIARRLRRMGVDVSALAPPKDAAGTGNSR